ncbi:branched-chain amino acid transport system II carrier protein [Clostridium sp. C105KSO13]|uniref:branched-chain amino acid transport system II carrier protein n=1 Tax=Clostridium sp. C105KSO13 TaxID=1776045 RepID=UPI0007407E8F|nr:branched-chain amino acid transport system II carrier protein [Clostridium sp. C105KSO13]CUX26581.1 Branched-chain amino acid transport system 2 carrier protein [Clostridium sp. C105KSO13]
MKKENLNQTKTGAENKLKFKDYLMIGSMLFGLFFGAGNLIFPVHLGQAAGMDVIWANLGFLVTGIGLPFLGVVAIGISQSEGVFQLATHVNRRYAYIFTILLYLVIGPLYAIPRLATTSFEIGLAPFVSKDMSVFMLALFSSLFFFIAWLLARKPTKLLDYIGKILNPLFLILLGFLLIMAFVRPMGPITGTMVQSDYQANAFFKGFVEGYNTLDALASLAFGIIIVSTIRSRGIKNPASIAVDTIKSGIISIVAMGVIYSLLAYVGTMSLGKFPLSENGGVALAQVANYYFGIYGSIILALIVIVACLKTAIGLITAFSKTFVELFPSLKYLTFTTGVSLLACLLANIGLTKIIHFSIPVLMFIYPLAMTLILLSIIGPLFHHDSCVYQATTYFTLLASVIDGINASPDIIRQTGAAQAMIHFGEENLPFFSIGMGWVLPAFVGFIIGLIWHRVKNKKL